MLSRFLVIFPLALAFVAFVLSNLCLFAGRDKGFMEDYAIARLNTSMLGHNMLDTNSSSSSSSDSSSSDDDASIWDKVGDKWNEIEDDITNEINNITGQIADQLAETLGISEWYSFHIMDACEGFYKPNATSPGAGFNITNCTATVPNNRFNLTKMLDKELQVGPFELSLADLGWHTGIQDALDTVNDALMALFVIFVLSIGFSGLSMLGCLAAFFLAGRPWVTIMNLTIASLGSLCLLIGSILVTVAAHKGVKKINKLGDDIGLSATKGNNFITLIWIATGFMLAVTMYWAAQVFLTKRQKKREWKNRKGSL